MKIDLHTHSCFSDGTDTPTQLLEKAKNADVAVIGLTDHDTIIGWEEAAAAAVKVGVTLVRGMEMTTQYQGVIVHLLAYLFDPEHPKLQEHFSRMQQGRSARVKEMAQRLVQDYPIDLERIFASAGAQATLGRPHLADELVRIGVVQDRSQAFAEILRPGSKYYVRTKSPDLLNAIAWIRDAGGKTVLAHSKAPSRGKVLSDQGIIQSAQAGLFGIEVAHRDQDLPQRIQLQQLAQQLALAQFGASDYHGTGKPNRLAENTTAADVYQNLIQGSFLPVISGEQYGI